MINITMVGIFMMIFDHPTAHPWRHVHPAIKPMARRRRSRGSLVSCPGRLVPRGTCAEFWGAFWWGFHGFSMSFPWVFQGVFYEFPWVFQGFSIGFPSSCQEIPCDYRSCVIAIAWAILFGCLLSWLTVDDEPGGCEGRHVHKRDK